MATRTSLYLTGDLEAELKARAQQRFGAGDAVSLGHIITRNLDLYFEACKNTRAKLAEAFTYEEMRFLCYVVASSNILEDIDDLNAYEQLTDDLHMAWMDKQDDEQDNGTKNPEEIKAGYDHDADWTYWRRVDPKALEAKVEALSTWETIALVDGTRVVLGSERKDREILRVFKGLRKTAE